MLPQKGSGFDLNAVSEAISLQSSRVMPMGPLVEVAPRGQGSGEGAGACSGSCVGSGAVGGAGSGSGVGVGDGAGFEEPGADGSFELGGWVEVPCFGGCSMCTRTRFETPWEDTARRPTTPTLAGVSRRTRLTNLPPPRVCTLLRILQCLSWPMRMRTVAAHAVPLKGIEPPLITSCVEVSSVVLAQDAEAPTGTRSAQAVSAAATRKAT